MISLPSDLVTIPNEDRPPMYDQIEAKLDIEIDLIKMIYYDQFLAENFIRCFFRYYTQLPTYLKEIFLDNYRDDHLLKFKETTASFQKITDLEHKLDQKLLLFD